MREILFIFILFHILLSTGCSAVASRRFFLPEPSAYKTTVSRPDWEIDKQGLIILGKLNPRLYKCSLDKQISYIIYPITIDERPLLIGPALLPVIPLWFDSVTPQEPFRYYRVKIVWLGDVVAAGKLSVYQLSSGEKIIGQQEIISSETNETVCTYTFAEKFTENSRLLIVAEDGNSSKEVQFRHKRNVIFVPLVSPGGP